MPTLVNRFEVQFPFANGGDPADIAINAFKASMLTLCPLHFTNFYDVAQNGTQTQSNFCSGYITNAQAATALGFLNTLNTALVAAGGSAVLCSTWPVTLEP